MLSEKFTTHPFEAALEHCRKYAREYYSCYPLVFQVGSLMVNHVIDGADPGGRGTGDKGSGTAVPPRERRYR